MAAHFLTASSLASTPERERIHVGWSDNLAAHPVRVRATRWEGEHKLGRAARRQRQSTVARQAMEDLLADIEPLSEHPRWVLQELSCGKLAAQGPGAPAVSLSHSQVWVVCAAGHVTRLGVDIEGLRSLDWAAAADLVLHPTELDWILAGQGTEQQWRGLQCWTNKEALLKAIGPTPERWAHIAQVAFSPAGQLLSLPPDWGSAADWTTHCWRLDEGAVLSVAWQ